MVLGANTEDILNVDSECLKHFKIPYVDSSPSRIYLLLVLNLLQIVRNIDAATVGIDMSRRSLVKVYPLISFF